VVVSIHRGIGNNGGGTGHHNGRINGAGSTQSNYQGCHPIEENRHGWKCQTSPDH